MRYNSYYYTYLVISCPLVVSLHQILVAFSEFSLESGLVRAARRWRVSARYRWDGAVRGRRIQDSERSTQDPVGACRSYLSEAADPMNTEAAMNRRRPYPLVVRWV